MTHLNDEQFVRTPRTGIQTHQKTQPRTDRSLVLAARSNVEEGGRRELSVPESLVPLILRAHVPKWAVVTSVQLREIIIGASRFPQALTEGRFQLCNMNCVRSSQNFPV